MSETTVLDLGIVRLEIDSGNVEMELGVFAERIANDKETMALMATMMLDMVYTRMMSGDFAPLAEATLERRKYPASGPYYSRGATESTKPLYAVGQSAGNLRERFRPGYAAVKRGKDDWWLFLHDRGKGRFDQRQFMMLSSADEGRLVDFWKEEVLETAVEAFNT